MIKEIDYKRRKVLILVGDRVVEERELTDDDMQLNLFSADMLNRIVPLKKDQPLTCQIA